MSDRAWMYTGHPSQKEMTKEWFLKTKEFVKAAFANGQERNYCPCPGCDNYKKTTQAVMIKHLQRRGFKPNYTVVHRRTDEHGTGIELRRRRRRPRTFYPSPPPPSPPPPPSS